MIELISLTAHPACHDRTARLVTEATRRDAVYSTANGFVAVFMGRAVAGFFNSLRAANNVLDQLTIGNGRTNYKPAGWTP